MDETPFKCRPNKSEGVVLTEPLGKKSRPTIDSRTDDFPADWVPKTAILGKLMYLVRPTSLNSSYTAHEQTHKQVVETNKRYGSRVRVTQSRAVVVIKRSVVPFFMSYVNDSTRSSFFPPRVSNLISLGVHHS